MTEETSEANIYSTRTLTLAAYLHSRGYNFRDTTRENGDTIFRFDDSVALQEDVKSHRLGKAVGNVNEYENSRRHMINLVKSR